MNTSMLGSPSNNVKYLIFTTIRQVKTNLLPRPPEGVARYCFEPVCVCVCVSVCVSVCPANILIFYFSAIRRDIDLKCIQDAYRVILNSLTFIVQRSRSQ